MVRLLLTRLPVATVPTVEERVVDATPPAVLLDTYDGCIHVKFELRVVYGVLVAMRCLGWFVTPKLSYCYQLSKSNATLLQFVQ